MMSRRTPLAAYINARLKERGENADEFAKRIGINPSGLYKLLRGEYESPRHSTLVKIAGGLDMTMPQLLAAVEDEPVEDWAERAVRARTPELMAIVRGAPEEKREWIFRTTFDQAIASARNMITLLGQPPVIDPAKGGLNATGRPVNEDLMGPEGHLSASYGLAKMLGMAA